MKATIRTKDGKTKQVEKGVAQMMVKRGEAQYVSPIPPKRANSYQTK